MPRFYTRLSVRMRMARAARAERERAGGSESWERSGSEKPGEKEGEEEGEETGEERG